MIPVKQTTGKQGTVAACQSNNNKTNAGRYPLYGDKK